MSHEHSEHAYRPLTPVQQQALSNAERSAGRREYREEQDSNRVRFGPTDLNKLQMKYGVDDGLIPGTTFHNKLIYDEANIYRRKLEAVHREEDAATLEDTGIKPAPRKYPLIRQPASGEVNYDPLNPTPVFGNPLDTTYGAWVDGEFRTDPRVFRQDPEPFIRTALEDSTFEKKEALAAYDQTGGRAGIIAFWLSVPLGIILSLVVLGATRNDPKPYLLPVVWFAGMMCIFGLIRLKQRLGAVKTLRKNKAKAAKKSTR